VTLALSLAMAFLPAAVAALALEDVIERHLFKPLPIAAAWAVGGALMQTYGLAELAAGFLAAWVAAMLSVAWMVQWLQHRRLAVFGWWRFAAAATVVWLVPTHRM
jgi:undecaprenyl pyrophosphate phosphatase UppP